MPHNYLIFAHPLLTGENTVPPQKLSMEVCRSKEGLGDNTARTSLNFFLSY